jgi:hypothetical protein
MADQLLTLGELKQAAATLAAVPQLLNDARTGILGNWAQYLEARAQFLQGRASAATMLETAVEGQRKISLQNYQIALANSMFDQQTLESRNAPTVYEALLADPKPVDAALLPLETMAVMTTNHEDAFERWLVATLERKNVNAALEITERAKRRRLHNALPWGGRLAALREILATPAGQLPPVRQQLQNDLLARFPEFAEAADAANQLRTQLDAAWGAPMDAEGLKKTAPLWQKYEQALAAREGLLEQIGVSRAAADLAFPPLKNAGDLQQSLNPGQALLVFHDTPQGMLGVLITSKAATHWNCGPSAQLAGLASQMLRDLGNHDANREMPVEELASDAWQASSAKLFEALFGGSSIAPSAVSELVVVPDGVVWYVPFEALMAEVDGKAAPLITLAKIRYAPTAGLAFNFAGPWRRVQRTGIVAGAALPGAKDPQIRAEMTAPLAAAISGALPLAQPLPAASPVVASLLDELIVLDDVETQGEHPLAWSPLPLDRNEQQGALTEWQGLAGVGPQRIMLPAMHTLAERGGKAASRRRGPAAVAPGDDLFYASCGLISSGAETLLLSRWRVGGQTMLDLVREFAQELPHAPAADAWQRSVQLAMQTPVDPLSELRVKAGKDAVDLTAAHPFFWAGYLVVDTGWRPEEPEPAEGDGEAPAEPPVADKAVPPQPAATAPGVVAPAEPVKKQAEGNPPAAGNPAIPPPVPTPPAK